VAQSPAIFPSRLAKYPRHKPFDGSSPRRIKHPRPNLCQTCWTSMACIPKALHSAHFLTHKSYKYPRKLRLCQGKDVSVGPINLPVPTTRSAAVFRTWWLAVSRAQLLAFQVSSNPWRQVLSKNSVPINPCVSHHFPY